MFRLYCIAHYKYIEIIYMVKFQITYFVPKTFPSLEDFFSCSHGQTISSYLVLHRNRGPKRIGESHRRPAILPLFSPSPIASSFQRRKLQKLDRSDARMRLDDDLLLNGYESLPCSFAANLIVNCFCFFFNFVGFLMYLLGICSDR